MSDVEKAEFEKAEARRERDHFREIWNRRTTVEIGRNGNGRVAIEDLLPGPYIVCVADPTNGSCGPTVRPQTRAAPVRLRLGADGSIAAAD